ncbi:thiolase family protein [Aeromicrobium sp. Marseille-Q0843]|uniref:Probable acetyl-CoA acetyltransferase n=1 Tax=Aeromicrobium phoceense TaxID=2754045 RepID=A0A838XCD1_9ACTN|nr:thiolase family protein [Aeromicrobium phoceense]MBA4609129.1 thiolase family protein [Aeromicrobium phoceense]
MQSFIIAAARTPIGRYGGTLARIRPDDLAATVIAELVKRASLDPEQVDEVILGAVNQAGEDNRNVARMALLLAGLPDTVPGLTVNRLCASSLSAIGTARQAVAARDADLVIAGGVESMTRAPWVMEKPQKAWGGPGATFDTAIGWRFPNPRFSAETTSSMPQTAERVAEQWGLERAELDEFALRSHERSVAAIKAGHFADEIVAVDGVDLDEGPRPDTTLERLSALRPLHGPGGLVTAGNSSSLNDGAAGVVVASEAYVERHGITPLARIAAVANAGVPPEIMGIGPVPATRKALDRAGWTIDDLDAVELNEAFASQSIACIRDLDLDPEIVNADGGAIALGHPLGASGARIVTTLLGRLQRTGGRRGLATMCVGVGQGVAILLERP